MKHQRANVRRFYLQPTPSYPDGAPQRESYATDAAFERACVNYADEWRRRYRCAGCNDAACPQCGPEGSVIA